MHIHILGICGTFMGGLALIARELGHEVTGSDANVYPPMSTQLEQQGITLQQGYRADNLEPRPDIVVIGNALSRGNPEVEAVLDQGLPYTSGAQWLAEQVLAAGRWTLAVAGTHGKTTTSSMLASILEHAGLAPGFLIGGVPGDFGHSARLGEGRHFVIEADEYDTAFFDKRSKFLHYRSRTLVLNNLEFDHADIFPDLAAIQLQFQYLLRTVPASGRIVYHAKDHNLQQVLERGCWTPAQGFDSEHGWALQALEKDGSEFSIHGPDDASGTVRWGLIGRHNMLNAVAAVAAAEHAGVAVDQACAALSQFSGVKRRLELRGSQAGVRVYDDFAHHPTAIRLTLEAMRAHVGSARIIAVLEPRSNTMRMGVHKDSLAASLALADSVYLVRSGDMDWDLGDVLDQLGDSGHVARDVDQAVAALVPSLRADDHVVVMSNGGFGDIHNKILQALGV